MITLLQYNASIVTPTDDAYLYNHIINDSGIFTGVEVTTQGGNIINVSDGRGIILGRNFVVEAQTINAMLPTSGSVPGRLLIQIDMANTEAPISFVTQAQDPLPALVHEDINASGTVYQLAIATYTAQPTMISDLQYVAHNITSGTVSSFNGRTGAVTPKDGDYTGSLIKMPGYKQASSRQNVSSSDTVTQAIGKMEYKINRTFVVEQITLPAASWMGAESPFKQNVTIANASINSLVSIQPSDEAYMELVESGVMLLRVDNVDGTFIATAIGEKPKNDLTLQAVINLVATSGSDPPKNSASEQIELDSELTGQILEPAESESKSWMTFSNSAIVDKVSSQNGEIKTAADIRSGASPESAFCVESSVKQLAVIKSEVNGVGITINKQERKEHIEITQPSPPGTEIILNPNKTGEKFYLFQSVPDGHEISHNPILFAEGLALSLPVPLGTAATVNKITGRGSVKLVQPIPTGDDVLSANGSSAHFASVKNIGKASIGDCVGGKSDGAVSAKNSAIPEILSSVPASQMAALKAVSDPQPQQIGLMDMLSILGMKMLWNAEAAAIIPWEYPVQNGDVLSVTQVYNAIQNDAVLEVT